MGKKFLREGSEYTKWHNDRKQNYWRKIMSCFYKFSLVFPPCPAHWQSRIRKLLLDWLTNAAHSFSVQYILHVEEWDFHYMQGSRHILLTGHNFHKKVSETHLEIWFIFILGTVRNENSFGIYSVFVRGIEYCTFENIWSFAERQEMNSQRGKWLFVWKALRWW